jgi:hypothetical protein
VDASGFAGLPLDQRLAAGDAGFSIVDLAGRADENLAIDGATLITADATVFSIDRGRT